MQVLPSFPLRISPVALLGLTLLLGLIGGEIARYTRILPRITGYIAVGILLGSGGLDIVTPSLLSYARIFVEVSLGLILFDLGRHLDFTWLKHDPGLLPTALTESTLTFIFIFLTLLFFGLPWQSAMIGGVIAVATSPAVVMMVAHDLSAEGPVTRRTLILTSLNNLISVVLFLVCIPLTQPDISWYLACGYILYRLLGSIALGLLMFCLTMSIGFLIGKRKENQFVLFSGMVIFTIGFALILHLSSILTVFTLGVAARNLDHKHYLIEVDFGWLARLFFILLFVVTGVQLQLRGIWIATFTVIAYLIMRFVAKSIGLWLFANKSRLTRQQTWALCFTLLPATETALIMSYKLFDFNPEYGYLLMTVITSVLAISYIISPIAAQIAFIKTNEAISNPHWRFMRTSQDPL